MCYAMALISEIYRVGSAGDIPSVQLQLLSRNFPQCLCWKPVGRRLLNCLERTFQDRFWRYVDGVLGPVEGHRGRKNFWFYDDIHGPLGSVIAENGKLARVVTLMIYIRVISEPTLDSPGCQAAQAF